jgi:hypothetical protein
MNLVATISPRYRGPILIGACFQAAFLLLGSLALDFGQLLQWTLFATITYWLMAALIISRRPQMPTKWDLILLRSGFVLILPVTITLTSLVWSWRGLP